MNAHPFLRNVSLSLTCGAIVVAVGAVTPVQAQFVNQAAARWYVNGAVANRVYNPYWGGGYAGGYGYGGYGYGGTTAGESYGRGMADVIRAQGDYELQSAQAAEAYEKARSQYIDNETKWLAEYNQRKRMGQAQHQEEQRQRREEINRRRSVAASNRAESQSDELPVPAQIDPETGEIAWPAALQQQRYAQATAKLNALTRQWAEGRDPSLLAPQVEQLADQLQKQLHANIKDYAANDFIAADRLLTSIQRLASLAG